jgi:hypothetical protein
MLPVDVQLAEPDVAFDATADVVVHAVDGPWKSRLATARRPDQGGHPTGRHLEGHAPPGHVAPEADRDVLEA